MNITNHAKERYVERIKGINNKNEIKQYIAQNENIVEDHILKLYNYSEKIFTGQIGGDKTTKDFYLSNDICLVIDGDCIRTIYKINFAFPEQTRLMVIEGLKDEIIKLKDEIETEMQDAESLKDDHDVRINNIKANIKLLKDAIEVKEDELKIHEQERNLLYKKIKQKNNYLQNYAEQLFGNTDYKKDMVL